MQHSAQYKVNASVYYRLVALWVLNEALLGGIIHGLKIPVSGLAVGSCAVLCIALIAWYVPQRGAILKATLIVAIFKMMLSPQAPSMAYFAVFFQGLAGELLFTNRRFYKPACFILAVIALVESGFQRIITLTIIYGNQFWTAVNDFINGLAGGGHSYNYSLLAGIVYLALHLVAGLMTGWLAATLPAKIESWSRLPGQRMIVDTPAATNIPGGTKGRKRIKTGLLIIWVLLLLLYCQSSFHIGKPLLPAHISLQILVRSVLIALAWYLVAGPALKQLLSRWLEKKKTGAGNEIQQVMQLLPSTRALVAQSWRRSSSLKGARKWMATLRRILVNGIYPIFPDQPAKRIVIYAGPVQTGKTTALVKWTEHRKDVFGILTPVVNGKRMFMDIRQRHLFSMEAENGVSPAIAVGRFRFSREAFDRAEELIRTTAPREGWMIIDEIGPLELNGQGFGTLLKDMLKDLNERFTLLLVVREGLVSQVREHFIESPSVLIHSADELPG